MAEDGQIDHPEEPCLPLWRLCSPPPCSLCLMVVDASMSTQGRLFCFVFRILGNSTDFIMTRRLSPNLSTTKCNPTAKDPPRTFPWEVFRTVPYRPTRNVDRAPGSTGMPAACTTVTLAARMQRTRKNRAMDLRVIRLPPLSDRRREGRHFQDQALLLGITCTPAGHSDEDTKGVNPEGYVSGLNGSGIGPHA